MKEFPLFTSSISIGILLNITERTSHKLNNVPHHLSSSIPFWGAANSVMKHPCEELIVEGKVKTGEKEAWRKRGMRIERVIERKTNGERHEEDKAQWIGFLVKLIWYSFFKNGYLSEHKHFNPYPIWKYNFSFANGYEISKN